MMLTAQSNIFANNAQPAITTAYIDSLNERAYRQVHVNVSKALLQLTDAEQMCDKIDYKKGLAINYMYQAEVFNQRGFTKRAIALYYNSLDLSRQNNDLYNLARALEHISSIKRHNGQLADAEKMLDTCFSIFKKLNKPIDIVNVQLRLGLLKIKEKQYQQALLMFQKAHDLSKSIKFQYGEKKTYYNRGELYREINNIDSAIYYYKTALVIDTLTHDRYGKALSYNGLANLYFKNKQFDEAAKYANAAQLNADSVHAQELAVVAIETLLKTATAKNNMPNIIKWQNKLLAIERSNKEIDRNDAIILVEVLKQQHDHELGIQKKIADIQKISQVKTVLLVCFLIVMVIVLLLVLSVTNNYRKAQAYAAALNEKNKQINEHSDSVAALNKKILAQNNILEEDNKLKNRLLSVISHDLRHPLTNTKSILSLINLRLVNHQETETLFGHLEAQYNRTVTLLDNLLYWIKSQIHNDKPRKSDVNLHELVNSLIEEQKLEAQKKHLVVQNLVSTLFEYRGEPELLKIIFRNLLTNAIKFTHREGAITFSAYNSNEELSITVKDTGIGMKPEVLQHIKNQGHYTSRGTANEDGNGLGLMLIRDLIRKMNGRLDIESDYGHGSTFTVTLVKVEEPVFED
ncbi:tetratricopeptide repeat-containing sensor histidine kinase [Mucilaginibacter sp. KACC 22063]|uniref:tetratricopeptide repeat-containing sensor histidine kinase n=1 Tax=Mucilaginibacter sp. KACC 22063 TaxID=3025666 RepID=UPI00236624DC|nr:tetratricopeptide repeat-containing sensor histidine kinase [Mucilaginibacter sp. KACC 22063]WDF57089.1 tetratricopeptide repeat-containing sensor histidine kinase [Mucilaginibacter sp. KACC 22063]